MSDYELMPFDPRNLAELQEIYRLSFGAEGAPSYFQWKYLDNPAGHASAFVARHKGHIAAFYGIIPEHYLIDGARRTIHQSMDTMTHPDHRGKGLFLKLARATYADLEERTGELHIIGYPGPTSIHGFVKRLEWRCLAEMRYHFIAPLMARTASLFHSDRGAQVGPITDLDPEWDAYFKGHDPRPTRMAKVLDRDVLRWRTWDHPTIQYEHVGIHIDGVPRGLCIYRKEASGRLFILLLDVKERADTSTVLSALMRYLFGLQGVKGVHTFLSGDPHLEHCLARQGAISNPFNKGPYSYRTPFIVLAGKKAVDQGAYDMGNYWIQPLTRDY